LSSIFDEFTTTEREEESSSASESQWQNASAENLEAKRNWKVDSSRSKVKISAYIVYHTPYLTRAEKGEALRRLARQSSVKGCLIIS
jgi:hypothetical protein